MRKTVLSTMIVALLLGVSGLASAPAAADSNVKTVAVVSLASYDQLLGNVEMAGKLAGRPKLAKGLEGTLAVLTHGRGLAGLDTKRPWGVVIQTKGSEVGGYAFLPIDDADQFAEVLEPYIKEAKDLGNGVRRLRGKGPAQEIYVKHIDSGWLFICDKPEGLAYTPPDPAKVLGGLDRQYDLAARLYVSNLPAEQREDLIAKLRQQAEKDLQKRPGESDQEYTVRKMVVTKIAEALLTMVKDLDTVTLGWSLDDDAQKVLLELAVTAKAGTKTADALAESGRMKTEFGGFRLPGAVLTGSVAAVCPQVDSADLDALFEVIRTKAFGDIDAREASAQKAKVGKEFVGGLLDVIQETVASGRADGAASLLLKPDAATLVAGRYVANGPKLQETLDKLVEAARQEDPAMVDEVLTTDVARVKDVRLHRLSLKVPDDAENRAKLVQLVGEKVEVVVGVGKQSFYLAAGRHALETLKKAIERSAAGPQQKAPPMELSVALGQVAEFLAEAGQGEQKQQALKAIEALEDAAGKDHLRLVALPTERGLKLRLELEEGVLKVIQAMPKPAAKRLKLSDLRR